MRKIFPAVYAAFFGLAILLPSLLLAQTQGSGSAAQPAAPAQSAQQTPAQNFIQDLGNKALAIIADKSLTPAQRNDKYRDLLTTNFDMPTIGKFVLGRAWNTASPEQQQEYLKLFEGLVVKIYGARLNFYSGEGFQVKGFRPESEKDIVVNSVITHPDGSTPTPIDWRVRQDNGKLGVIDVTVDGVSQSVTQRQEYASILERNNGNIDGLLAMMRQKLQQGDNTPTTQ